MSNFHERRPLKKDSRPTYPHIPFHRDARQMLTAQQIGEGAETHVFQIHSKRSPQSPNRPREIVVKNYLKGADAGNNTIPGFDSRAKEALIQQMNLLIREYDVIIPPYQIIPHPDEPEHFLLAQPFIDGNSVYNFRHFEWLQDAGRSRLQQFVLALKRNFLLANNNQPFVLPDLLPQNVRIDAAQHTYYLDSGAYTRTNQIHDLFYAAQIASLDLLAGGDSRTMRKDPVYSNFFKEEKRFFSTSDFSNPKTLYCALRAYLYGEES